MNNCFFFFLSFFQIPIVNSIRTVHWPELLPKITIHIDEERFQMLNSGKRKFI